MMSQKSSSKNHIFRNMYWHTIKRNLGMTGIYSLLLLVIYPLKSLYLLLFDSGNFAIFPIDVIGLLVPIVFCVLFPLMVFRYLHSKTATDLYHSLPIQRTPLFLSKYLAGITMLFVPFIVIVSADTVINGLAYRHYMQIPGYSSANYAFADELLAGFQRMALVVFVLLCLYALTVFIMMNTGTTLDAVVTLVAVNVGWVLLMAALQSFFNGMLYGFPGISSDIITHVTIIFSPLAALFYSVGYYGGYLGYYGYVDSYSSNYISFIGVLVVVSALALAGSLLIYRKRKSEYAGRVFSYPYMKALIKVIVCLSVGIVVAMGLSSSHSNTKDAVSSFVIGFLAASFVSYLIVHIILSRGFKKLGKSLILYGSAVVCFALVYFGVGFDVIGYQARVPKAEDVAYIEVTGSSYGYLAEPMQSMTQQPFNIKYTEQDSKKAFIALHQGLVDEIKKDQDSAFVLGRSNKQIGKDYYDYYDYGSYYTYEPAYNEPVYEETNPQKRYDSVPVNTEYYNNTITLTYHLNNGLPMTRKYWYNNYTFQDQLKNIYDLEEYKTKQNPLFALDLSQDITAMVYDDYSDYSYAADEELTKRLIEAMQKDYRVASQADLNQNPVAAVILRSDEMEARMNPDGYYYHYKNKKYQNYYDVPYSQMGTYGIPYENCYFVYPGFDNTIALLELETQRSFREFPEGTKALVCNYLTLGLWDGYDYNLADDYKELQCDIVSDPAQLDRLRYVSMKYDRDEMTSGFFLQYYYPDGTRSQLFYCWGNDMPAFYYSLNFRTLDESEIQTLGQ